MAYKDEANLDVAAPPDAGNDTPAPDEGATEETATIPAISIGGVPCKVGDTLEVVSADGDNLTVKYVSHEENPEEAPGNEESPEGGKGVSGMAAAFD